MGIFISYRKADQEGALLARKLRDSLAAHFGSGNVVIDPPVEFHDNPSGWLGKTDVLLAIIGPRWLSLLNERLGENDYVREEIAYALEREHDIRVIPVLVEGVELPRYSELPKPVQVLSYRSSLSIGHRNFNRDTAALVRAIRASETPHAPTLSKRRGVTRLRLLALLLTAVGVSSAYIFAYPILDSPAFQSFLSGRSQEAQAKRDRSNLDIADVDIFYLDSDLPETPVAKASSEDCRNECKRRSECRAFSYVRADRLCYLKAAATSQKTKSDTISGRMLRSSIPTAD